MGGFISETSPPSTLKASKAEDEDDGDASSFGIDAMSI